MEEPEHECTDDWCLYYCDACGEQICLEEKDSYHSDPLGNKFCVECSSDNS